MPSSREVTSLLAEVLLGIPCGEYCRLMCCTLVMGMASIVAANSKLETYFPSISLLYPIFIANF